MSCDFTKLSLGFYNLKYYFSENDKLKKSNTIDYLFVGKNLPKDVKEVLESKKLDTKENTELLKKVYGDDYKILTNIIKNSKNYKLIYESIFKDDNINILKRKINLYLYDELDKKSWPENQYLWICEKNINNETSIDYIRSNIFRFKDTIGKDDYDNEVKKYFFNDVSINKNTISIDDVYQKLINVNNLKNYRSIEFDYRISDRIKANFFINPLETQTEVQFLDNTKKFDLKFAKIDNSLKNLEDFNIKNNTICFILASDISKNKNFEMNYLKYFPFINNLKDLDDIESKSTKIKSDDQNILVGSDNIVNSLYENIDENNNKIVSSQCSIENLNFSTTPYELTEIELDLIYKKINTDNDIPVIVFMEGDKKTFKINVDNIGEKINKDVRKVPEQTLKSWVKIKEKSLLDKNIVTKGKSLIFYIYLTKFREDKYFSLKLNNDMTFSVKYTFKQDEIANMDMIEKSFNTINKLIDKIEDVLNKTIFIKMKSIFQENVSILSFVNSVVVNTNRALDPIDEIKKNTNIYFPFFNEPKIKEKTKFVNKYRRVGDYQNFTDIIELINKNINKPQKDIVEIIANEFNKTIEEAQKIYDDNKFEAENKIKFNNGLTLNFKRNTDLQLKVDIAQPQQPKSLTSLNFISIITNLFLLISTIKKKDLEKLEVKKSIKNNFLKILTDVEQVSQEELERTETEILENLMKQDSLDSSIDFDNDDEDTFVFDDDDFDFGSPTSSQGGGAGKQENRNKILKTRDPELFGFKKEKNFSGYASTCGAVDKRQPVLVTKQELENIDKTQPNSYTNFVNAGSDEKKFKENVYFCPRIWCPVSRISITEKVLKENDGKCPAPNSEDPVILDTKYWKDKKTDNFQEAFVAFLDRSKHPKGFCMPCCFSSDKSKSKAGKQLYDSCISEHDSKKEEETGEEAKSFKTEPKDKKVIKKYIQNNEKLLPLDTHGKVPDIFTNLFDNKNPEGLITNNTDTIVRKGIIHENQSFLSCMISVLNNNKINNIDDFKRILSDKLSLDQFIKLNNSHTMKAYMADLKNIDNVEEKFNSFKKEYPTHKKYIKQFGQEKLVEKINDYTYTILEKTDSESIPIIREFLIYCSYKNFINYINSDVYKEHEEVYDLFIKETSWLNVNKYNFIIIETKNDKINLICPRYSNFMTNIDTSKPFVFIFKRNDRVKEDNYEPLYHITFDKTRVNENNKFYLFRVNQEKQVKAGTKDDIFKDIITTFINKCNKNNYNVEEQKLYAFLESNRIFVNYFVINYSYKIVGYILENNLFVPLPYSVELMTHTDKDKFMYYEEIFDLDVKATIDEVKKIYNTINDYTKNDFYTIKKVDNDKKFVTLKNDIHIPLKKDSDFNKLENIIIDASIFTSFKRKDPRVKLFEDKLDKDTEKISSLETKIIRLISKNKHIEDEIKFYKNKLNPYPTYYKKEKIKELLESLKVEELEGEYLEEVINDIMIKNISFIIKDNIKTSLNRNEIELTQRDIINNKLDSILEELKNPFNIAKNTIEDFINNEETPFEFDKDKYYPNDNFLTSKNTKIKPETPWQVLLKKFTVNLTDKYSNDYIYNILNNVSKITDNFRRKEMFDSILSKSLEFQYKNNRKEVIDIMFKNKSFYSLIKNKNKLDTTLDDIKEVLKNKNYLLGRYELTILSIYLGINIVILARRNPKGMTQEAIQDFNCLYVGNSNIRDIEQEVENNKFLVFNYTKEKEMDYEYDRFNLVVKGKQFLFSFKDFPVKFQKMLIENCTL